ncbi:hypothetical protein V8E54_004615 [Elaphomyces granulatus]
MTHPSLHRQGDGRSQQPLLKDEGRGRLPNIFPPGDEGGQGIRPSASRRSTFRSRTPDYDAKNSTKRKYIYAAGFLVLSLISFTVQTETAVYIQHELQWDKPYCMLYFTHSSWILLWPVQLLILRIQKRKLTWKAFWRRHIYLLRITAQMVETQDLHLTSRDYGKSPVLYMFRTTAFLTSALTVAGGSWYVAVNMTTASDLTAIYNCSAFFAYVFSIFLLREKIRLDKVLSVVVAIVGVIVVAYGGSHSSGSTDKSSQTASETGGRTMGNIIIGIGSILYGLYEVLYKRYACPPEGSSPGRSVIFANTVGSMIGAFTLLVLWIPLPIFHILGVEEFRWPTGEAGWLLIISILANATFSGSFLVLMSLTSPVLSSVAALLTIFLVAIVDWGLTGNPLSAASITGGFIIIAAFLLLSWSTYCELDEERRHRLLDEEPESESDE